MLPQEERSGCCVRNDNSGCVQSLASECSPLLSTWHRWTAAAPGPDGRVSGPVCGQDPQYCSAPRSSYTSTWRDNITTWPGKQQLVPTRVLYSVYPQCATCPRCPAPAPTSV